jgi:CRISPR-associated DxTHG motif protein
MINFKGEMMKKAVITILGIQGGYVQNNEVKFTNFDHKAKYYFEDQAKKYAKEFFNTLPLLITKYQDSYDIIPIFTKDARLFNEAVLQQGYSDLPVIFDDQYFLKDEKDFKNIFSIIDTTIEKYDEVIVDVSHGFRHLPILMTVDLLIQNFKNTQKINHIWFAKEKEKHDKDTQGLYEMIDLKEYLELANIAFILSTFEKNYTVANHIKSIKYPDLMIALNDFSNDIMALSLNHLFTISAPRLIEKLNAIVDDSMKKQATILSEHIVKLTTYNGKKRYQTYFDLSEDLFNKNYMLLSLALLYESIRMYIKTTIKKGHPELIGRVETFFNGDLYKIGFFCKNLKDKDFGTLTKKLKNQITEEEYKILKANFKNLNIKDLYEKIDKKRNNLAHANSDTNAFQTIKDDIQKLLKEYEDNFINPK